MITLYGIPNCDTIKKARQWLQAHDIDYRFHNYKTDGVPEKELKFWIKKAGWETLLNKRGATWRKLDDPIKDNLTEKTAIQLMRGNPSLIKRPVLDSDGRIIIGYTEDEYARITGK